MRRLIYAQLLILCLGLGLAWGQNTAKFPDRAATTADLGVASNRAATTLTSGVNSSATSLPVASSTGFKAGSFVTMDSEIVAVCSIPDGNHLNVGLSSCPNADGRGIDTSNGGGAAASHLASAAVQGRIVAWHVNQTAAELVAVETKLSGPRAYGAKGDGSTDDTTAFTNALAAQTTLIVPAGTYTVTGLTLSTTNQRMLCESGAVIQARSSTSQVLTFTGTGEEVRGCTFDGASNGSTSTQLVYANSPTKFVFAGNTIKGTVTGQYGFRCITCVDGDVSGNELYSILGPGISIDDGSTRVLVSRNRVDHTAATSGVSGGSAIQSQVSNTLGTAISQITIADNTIVTSVKFCVEVGNFVSASTDGTLFGFATIRGNTCKLASVPGSSNNCSAATSPTACGGYSGALGQYIVWDANTFDANGQELDIAGIEATRCDDCIVNSNQLNGKNTASHAAIAGISAACQHCIITSNEVNNFTGVTGSIYLNIPSTYTTLNNAIVRDNHVTVTASADQGIYANCNRASGNILRLQIAGNSIIGQGSTVGSGVVVAQNNGTCTVDGLLAGPNVFSNLSKGYVWAVVTNILLNDSQFSNVTTKVQDNGGSSTYAPNHIQGKLRIGSNTDPSATLDVTGSGAFSSTFSATGGANLSGGVMIGNTGAALAAVHIHGVTSHDGTNCMDPVDDTDCNTVHNASSPIFRWIAGDGVAKYRLDSSMSSTLFKLDSLDANPIWIGSGSQEWLQGDTNGILEHNPKTVGSLLTCDANNVGRRTYVTDSSVTTFGSNVAGGGANKVGVVCNGSNYTVYWK